MPESSPRLSPTNNKVDTDDSPTSAKRLLENADKPRDLSLLAFAVTILFNHVLGYFAYHFTASAQHSWNLNDHKTSKRHAKYALILIVLGLILGGMTYTIALSVYLTTDKDPACTSEQSAYGNKDNSTHLNQTTALSSLETTTTTPPPTTTTTPTTTAISSTASCCRHCTRTGDQHCSVYCSGTNPDGPIYIDRSPNRKFDSCCEVMSCL